MASRTPYGRALPLIVAAGVSMTCALRAHAQTVPADDDQDAALAESAPDANDPDIRDLQLDWSQLNVDASTLATRPASKSRSPQAGAGSDASWSSKDNPNGSAAVSVKQPLSPFWDTRIGADMTVTRGPSTLTTSELLSERLANGGSQPQSSAAAWAAMSAPGLGSIWDKTAIEARVDPSDDTTKLGTSLSKSLPLSEQYSLTLQNGYNVIQHGVVALPGIVGYTIRNYEVDRSAKLSITDTGTSLIAGQTLSSADDKWLGKIGAEQKLFDGVSISASVGETSLGTTNKSLSAGFRRSW